MEAAAFKKVPQAYGSVIILFTQKCEELKVSINDPKAAAEFAKIMKLCVKETQKFYTPRA